MTKWEPGTDDYIHAPRYSNDGSRQTLCGYIWFPPPSLGDRRMVRGGGPKVAQLWRTNVTCPECRRLDTRKVEE